VGTYPGLILTFPRDDKDFDKRCEETRKLFESGKLEYSAAFTSSEVKIIAPTKTKKSKDTQVDLPVEGNQMDIEAEADR
jgi:hypothetical protein